MKRRWGPGDREPVPLVARGRKLGGGGELDGEPPLRRDSGVVARSSSDLSRSAIRERERGVFFLWIRCVGVIGVHGLS